MAFVVTSFSSALFMAASNCTTPWQLWLLAARAWGLMSCLRRLCLEGGCGHAWQCRSHASNRDMQTAGHCCARIGSVSKRLVVCRAALSLLLGRKNGRWRNHLQHHPVCQGP